MVHSVLRSVREGRVMYSAYAVLHCPEGGMTSGLVSSHFAARIQIFTILGSGTGVKSEGEK